MGNNPWALSRTISRPRKRTFSLILRLGYNFKSLSDISHFLEHSGSGISSLWSRTTALKYDCTVITGYPEKVDPALKWPTNPEYYNAAIVVNGEGETVANYRKTHLYYTDETWALEGPSGFYGRRLEGLGRTAIGICMDLKYVYFAKLVVPIRYWKRSC